MANNNRNSKNSSHPKRRHDGTSPLPLGMDWSPPPKRWDGRYTVWPHGPCAGWSYCVMVPSWIVKAESGASSAGSLNTIIFFRVLVGIQSPEGISTSHVILRRFSDFRKLFSAVRSAFPRKHIPQAPPKFSLSNVNSSRILLEERRGALEEWIGKLLSDIDLSRSTPMATFLELEAAVRECASVTDLTGSSMSLSTLSEFSSINEISNHGGPHASEHGGTDTVSAHALYAVGKSLHDAIVEECSGGLFTSEGEHGKEKSDSLQDNFCGNYSKKPILSEKNVELTAEHNQGKVSCHARNFSTKSIMSDISLDESSELTKPCSISSLGDESVNLLHGAEFPSEAFYGQEVNCINDVLVIHPIDLQHKLIKFLASMNQKIEAATTDMEDLVAQLDQESIVNKYFTAKLKDLEAELEFAKRKSEEDLQKAILLERERVTQILWDMDELLGNYKSIESKFNSEVDERVLVKSESAYFLHEKESLLRELDNKTEQLKNLQRHQDELLIKSKSDIRVLAKEVKYLRSSRAELKEILDRTLKEKTELEIVLQKERQNREPLKLARRKIIDVCEDLRNRLQQSSGNFLAEGNDSFNVDPSSLPDALGLLTTSDTRIGLLLAEAQLLRQDDEHGINNADAPALSATDDPRMISEDEMSTDDDIRKLLSDAFVDIALLRKQLNSVVRCALKTIIKPPYDYSSETPPRKTALDIFLGR